MDDSKTRKPIRLCSHCGEESPFGALRCRLCGTFWNEKEQYNDFHFWLPGVLLSLGFGSAVKEVTVAVLLSRPGVGALTTMVCTKVAPLARSPGLQVTVPAASLQPGAETKFTPAGRVSVRVAPRTVEGPLLVTVRV